MNFEGQKAPRGRDSERNEEDRPRIAESLGLGSDASWEDIENAEEVLGKQEEPKTNHPRGAAAA